MLPVQSRALTYLLNMPEAAADTWIGWGMHVFKVAGGEFKKGTVLEDYLRAEFDRAAANPGEDFFSALTKAKAADVVFRRRSIKGEFERAGQAMDVFAGRGDLLVERPSHLAALREHFFGIHPRGGSSAAPRIPDASARGQEGLRAGVRACGASVPGGGLFDDPP